MHLETTETHASLALALVPPGNILRDLAMIRGRLFTLDGLQGSRAWFDFPVLAWLSRALDGGLLASLASSFRLPLEFEPLRWVGNYLSMPVPAAFNEALQPGLSPYILATQAPFEGDIPTQGAASGSETWGPGPFPAGKGMICAVVDEEARSGIADGTRQADLLAQANRLAGNLPRAHVYSLALVELHWYPGPNFGSSWAILSSVVAGRLRSASQPIPVNGRQA
jgi:hypothetical protein